MVYTASVLLFEIRGGINGLKEWFIGHFPLEVRPSNFEVKLVGINIKQLKFCPYFLQNPFFSLPVLRNKGELAANPHGAVGTKIEFKFLFVTDAESLGGKLGLNPHGG